MLAQPELPFASQLLQGGEGDQWYQDSGDRVWQARELVQTLMSQMVTSARDVAFERHWQATVAVESECMPLLQQWLTRESGTIDCTIQALVSRQVALAAHWSSLQRARQTVITIDWAPRQIHLGIFTCSVDGSFQLVHAKSLSGIGLIAWHKAIARAIVPSIADRISSESEACELHAAIGGLWVQAMTSASGVGKQECWIDGHLSELVLCKQHLQELAKPFCQQIIDELTRSLAQLRLQPDDADRVVLLGGPNELLRAELLRHGVCQPETCVALTASNAIANGAAILSGLSPARLQKIVEADKAILQASASIETDAAKRVASRQCPANCDIGLRIGHPARGKSMIYKLIDAQTELPARRSRTFRTSRPNQSRLILELVYVSPATGRIEGQETRSLPLPDGLPAYAPIEVTVSRLASGQVDIEV